MDIRIPMPFQCTIRMSIRVFLSEWIFRHGYYILQWILHGHFNPGGEKRIYVQATYGNTDITNSHDQVHQQMQ